MFSARVQFVSCESAAVEMIFAWALSCSNKDEDYCISLAQIPREREFNIVKPFLCGKNIFSYKKKKKKFFYCHSNSESTQLSLAVGDCFVY
jgi:hypothetical protein